MRKQSPCTFVVFILQDFAAAAHARQLEKNDADGAQGSTMKSRYQLSDAWVNMLVSRGIPGPSFVISDLDDTTQGKNINLGVKPRLALSSLPTSQAQQRAMRHTPRSSSSGQAQQFRTAADVATKSIHDPFHRVGTTRIAVAKAAETSDKTSGSNAMAYNEVDEAAMIAAAGFPIGPEELVSRTKDILKMDLTKAPDYLSEDFQFIGPVVGPLEKEPFLNAIAGFDDFACAFPDMKNNYHSFRVDPFEPNRVWFDSRTMATHTGTLSGRIKPTGTNVVCPPQALSYTFNEKGQVRKITVGVVMDRTVGNTGGLGGIFALFYAVGSPLPFPEANPWKASKRYRFFNWLATKLQPKKPKPSA